MADGAGAFEGQVAFVPEIQFKKPAVILGIAGSNGLDSTHIVNKAIIENRKDANRQITAIINVQKKKVKALFSEILYIESQRKYIKIATTKREFVTKMSTHEIESLLPANLFKRIHRSFIISLSKIESYTAEMVEVNGISIPIGRGYRDALENL